MSINNGNEQIFIKGREVVSKTQFTEALSNLRTDLYNGIITLRIHASCDDSNILNPNTKSKYYLTSDNTDGLDKFMELYMEENYNKANILLFAIFDDRLIPFTNGVTSPPANKNITFYSSNVQDDLGNITLYKLVYQVSTQKVYITRESDSYIKRSVVNSLIDSVKEYTDTQITTAIAGVSQFSLLPVDTLPTEDIKTNVIYAVPSDDPKEKDVRIEYVYINDDWEALGTTKIDLSNYYTKAEIDAMFASIANYTPVATAEEAANILNGTEGSEE